MNTDLQSDHSSNQPDSEHRRGLLLLPLWASAFILAALVIVQTGHLGPGNAALGEMSTAGTDYSMMTTNSGNGEILTVMNSRDGRLFVYDVTSSSGISLVDRISIAELVARAGKRSDGN